MLINDKVAKYKELCACFLVYTLPIFDVGLQASAWPLITGHNNIITRNDDIFVGDAANMYW